MKALVATVCFHCIPVAYVKMFFVAE